MSPTNKKNKAIRIVITVALKGSPFLVSFDKSALIPLFGMIPSEAKACKVLGATIIEPKALENVAAASPMAMIGPHNAILPMIS